MNFHNSKEKHLYHTFSSILFSLIPFFLVTGPFLADLSISLINILFLVYCLKKKNFSYFKNKYFFIFLIFCFYLILNSLINNFNLDSLKISIFYFRYGVFVVAVVALLKFNDDFLRYFFYCIFGIFIILILDGYYQYFVGENIFGIQSGSNVRTSSFFGEEKILGSYLSRLWPIFFGLSIILYKKKKNFFLLTILVFILSETLIFLSGDRTAFFFINLSAIFVILLSNKLYKLRLFTMLLSVLLIILISFVNPVAYDRVFNQTIKQMNLDDKKKREQEGLLIFSKQHTHHYITAYRMFLENKVLGVGVKNFRNFCDDARYEKSKLSCSTHPHNFYIQILAETGIIGFLFLLTFLLYFSKFIFKHLWLRFKKKFYFNDFEICILSGILIYLWPFVPTGNVFNNWINIITILNFPLLIWSLCLDNSSNNNKIVFSRR